MSEASEVSKQEKLMGTWEILGESIFCGISAAGIGALLPITGAPAAFIISCGLMKDKNWGVFSILGFCLTAALVAGTYFFFAALTAPIRFAISGGLAAAAFVITTIAVAIDCLRKNAKIKRKQEQANPKAKEDREQEIAKAKEDITQGTQKKDNPEIINDVEKPPSGNPNEFFSDDEPTSTEYNKNIDL